MVKKIPMRQCTGCREMKEKRSLIRVVRSPEGAITLDSRGKSPGPAIPPEIYEALAARLQEGAGGDG